jgi:hypothetical protein
MFSAKTILDLVEAYKFRTHDEITRFTLVWQIEGAIPKGSWIKEKETAIARYLIEHPDATGPGSANLTIEIIENLLERVGDFESFREMHGNLNRSLDRDGFEVTPTGVRRKLPETLHLVEQEDALMSLLDRNEFTVAKGHYNQAIAAHGRGEWASANGQLRTFVEEIFDRMHDLICPGREVTSNARREALARAGFFLESLNEWNIGGKGFVQGFYKRLHPAGSHPGLSEPDDSTFRVHLVILVAHYFLKRLDAWPQRGE